MGASYLEFGEVERMRGDGYDTSGQSNKKNKQLQIVYDSKTKERKKRGIGLKMVNSVLDHLQPCKPCQRFLRTGQVVNSRVSLTRAEAMNR